MSAIGVIGDVHCNHNLLKLSIDFLMGSCDQVLCVGDVVDGPGNPEECISLLSVNQITTLLGNHDEWCIRRTNLNLPDATDIELLSDSSRFFLGQMPRSIRVGRGLLVCHGLDNNNMGKIKPDDYGYSLEVNEDFHRVNADRSIELLVKGHDHTAWYGNIDRTTIVCTGSLQEKVGGFIRIDDEIGNLEMFSFEGNKIISIGEHRYRENGRPTF